MKAGILQLTEHEHTGKFRPHRHTSYASLTFVLLVAGMLLLASSWAAQASVPAVNPQTGSVGLSGVVPGPPPSSPATILSPSAGSHVTTSPVTVTGTCATNTFVSIEKNQVFGGVVACGDGGAFSLLVDLFDGSNSLVVRVSDALGQYGPDSSPVVVFYDAPSGGTFSGTIGKQLFIESQSSVIGSDPNISVSRTVTIVGGVGPYAISWDWGDGKSDLASQAGDGEITGTHVYTQAGSYQVIVRVTDSLGNSALIQLLTVINGPVAKYGVTNGSGPGAIGGALVTAWPLFGMAVLMVIVFWIGERRELYKLRRKNLTVV